VEVLYNDEDEYVMKRVGRAGNGANPGLILYINISENSKRREVLTNWAGKKLMDYSGKTSYSPIVSTDGRVSIEAPANSYSIWSVME
jgi:alpha-amylase